MRHVWTRMQKWRRGCHHLRKIALPLLKECKEATRLYHGPSSSSLYDVVLEQGQAAYLGPLSCCSEYRWEGLASEEREEKLGGLDPKTRKSSFKNSHSAWATVVTGCMNRGRRWASRPATPLCCNSATKHEDPHPVLLSIKIFISVLPSMKILNSVWSNVKVFNSVLPSINISSRSCQVSRQSNTENSVR